MKYLLLREGAGSYYSSTYICHCCSSIRAEITNDKFESTCDKSTHRDQPRGGVTSDLIKAALQKCQSPSPWRIPAAFLAFLAGRGPSFLEELWQRGGRRSWWTSPRGRPTSPRWLGWEPFKVKRESIKFGLSNND